MSSECPEESNYTSVSKYGDAITFQERSACISCGGKTLDSIWQGQFSDQPTHSLLQQFHYHGEVVNILGNHEFALVRCQDCGMTFHRTILTEDWLRVLYSQWIDDSQIESLEAFTHGSDRAKAKFEEGRQLTKHVLRLQKLLSSNHSEPFRILDYGCGDGKFLNLAAAFGFEAYGLDFSSTRGKRAERTALTVLKDWEDFDQLKVKKLHAVTLFQVLEHLADPVGVLKAIKDRMEDGGILIVEVPNCQGIVQPGNFEEFKAVQPLEHINAFTPATLRKMCEQMGFVGIPRPATHLTTEVTELLRTEASRMIHPSSTQQYFRLSK